MLLPTIVPDTHISKITAENSYHAGPLKKVTIARDREGCQRSYGFVCYKHQEAVPYAIALLNGISLYGRPIRLQYSFGSSHSDGGTGPSDPPLEPCSANTFFQESPMYHISAPPNGRGPSQDQLHWNSLVCGYSSQQFPPNIFPPQLQCFLPPSTFCPPAPRLPWPALELPPWTPPPPVQPSQNHQVLTSHQLALPPSPPPGMEGQEGHTDGVEPKKPRKHRRSREHRHRSKKHRSKLGGRLHARVRTHVSRQVHTAFISPVVEDGKAPQREDLLQ
ncbi:hypothetical protein JZ751_022649 [Albula glossodonta]|uniref:RRM domain-containing protein n=1 Tax=Albula glossodonta TaxID=121402 RepID=A0A8T2PGU6_9TELE|nr:hypothetical protein JZ751_022649 [Albula glossodonta]